MLATRAVLEKDIRYIDSLFINHTAYQNQNYKLTVLSFYCIEYAFNLAYQYLSYTHSMQNIFLTLILIEYIQCYEIRKKSLLTNSYWRTKEGNSIPKNKRQHRVFPSMPSFDRQNVQFQGVLPHNTVCSQPKLQPRLSLKHELPVALFKRT